MERSLADQGCDFSDGISADIMLPYYYTPIAITVIPSASGLVAWFTSPMDFHAGMGHSRTDRLARACMRHSLTKLVLLCFLCPL